MNLWRAASRFTPSTQQCFFSSTTPSSSLSPPPTFAKPVFHDMRHSNNAARIRIWLDLKELHHEVDTTWVKYEDLQSPEFAKVNPLRKVPGLVLPSGDTLFESSVILDYLEDKFSDYVPPSRTEPLSLQPDTPEGRAKMRLSVRIHDLYIASPNCTQPGFTHTQGAMYLAPYETKHCSADRTINRGDRASKLKEMWSQLVWLENSIQGEYLVGNEITHADLTWFPTAVFMEYLLPRVFGWECVFRESPKSFPKLHHWFHKCEENPHFARVREDIWQHWLAKNEEGQFDSIREETTDQTFKWVYP